MQWLTKKIHLLLFEYMHDDKKNQIKFFLKSWIFPKFVSTFERDSIWSFSLQCSFNTSSLVLRLINDQWMEYSQVFATNDGWISSDHIIANFRQFAEYDNFLLDTVDFFFRFTIICHKIAKFFITEKWLFNFLSNFGYFW